ACRSISASRCRESIHRGDDRHAPRRDARRSRTTEGAARMTQPFLGELRIMPFGVVPNGWALCNGQLMAISSNPALFALLSTNSGGTGQTTFALPNLQGRVPVGVGNGIKLGQQLGEYTHALTEAEIPAHTHVMQGKAATATTALPSENASLAQGRSTGPGTP